MQLVSQLRLFIKSASVFLKSFSKRKSLVAANFIEDSAFVNGHKSFIACRKKNLPY